MTIVCFYEKPGCINNTRQKTLLTAAGHTLEVHNLLTTPWTAETLRPFFGDRPISQWFNPSAPAIKAREVIPEQLNETTALALMVQNPLLIRRPLMQVGDRREAGFDIATVEAWLGLQATGSAQHTKSETLMQRDLANCPRAATLPTETLNSGFWTSS